MTYPVVRSSIVAQYAALARTHGLDPMAMLRTVGLPARCLVQPDLRVRVGKINRLLELSAHEARVSDFGLQLSRTRRLSSLGALGALMRDERSVRDAIRRSIHSAHLNSTAIWLQLFEREGTALVRLTLDADGQPIVQSVEMALGGLFSVMRHLLGPAWKPRAIHFIHEAASPPSAYRRFFGCPVHFGGEFNGILLGSDELDRPIPLADENLRRYAVAASATLLPRGRPVTVRAAKQQILTLLPDGRCGCAEVAASLGVDRRTLHRHLQAEGRSFSAIHDEVRLDLARQYLRAGRLSASETAELLGFDALSSFSRWFKRQTGSAPTRWAPGARGGTAGA